MHTNVFCITPEGGVVPAAMSLARMSLRQGVEDRVWREHQGEVKWINWHPDYKFSDWLI